jgi:hypothetical protein
MSEDRLRNAVPEGEALRYSGTLRRGGSLGLTDERLLVVRDDEDPMSVAISDVEAVDFADLDWTLAVMSALLVGFGVLSLGRSVPAGVGFAIAGVASMYLTYRKRDRTIVRTHSRSKPLSLYPANASEFYDAFGRALETYRERTGEEAAAV